MSEQIPAGWYPDPKETGEPRPQRWWDGKGWTASTRPAPSDAPTPTPPPAAPEPPAAEPTSGGEPTEPTEPVEAGTAEQPRVLEGEVLASGPTVRYPEPPPVGAVWGAPVEAPRKPRRKPSKLVVATVVAAVLGLGAGSGITYLAMDGRDHDRPLRSAPQAAPGDGNGPFGGLPGFGNGGGSNGGNGGSGGSGGSGSTGGDGSNGGSTGGNGKGGGKTKPGAGTAIDIVNRLSLKVPSGWTGEITPDGYAMLSVGEYACADDPTKSCSLGGVNTGRIDGGGSDAQAAAKADIEQAVKTSYGDVTGHQELKNEAVTVNGQNGWLVRWKVNAAKGNDGYVQTAVFPSSDGKSLISVHFGFDVADKAPDVALMDTILKGITDYKGKLPALPAPNGGQSGGSGGGQSGAGGTST
ncbi:DUF2510 domain-containing protein [Kitasatospora sp. NPDC101183]|uniref:DUF2510 domain-containing protein n=1 Tax=Kitasatospora sp. NPDC101183 TaxID=3364100 RepID=UPI0038143729